MSENKFTPGPWEPGFGEGISGHRASFTVYLEDSGCKEIPIKVKGSTDMICIIPFDLDEDEAIADASLIAAAPELLEALEAWKSAEEYGNKYNHLKDAQEEIAAAWEHAEKLRDKAIAKAKAKGESNV